MFVLVSNHASRNRLSEPKGSGSAQRRAGAPLRCGVLVDAHCEGQAQPEGMARALAKSGHCIFHLNPQAPMLDIANSPWLTGLDLLIARGRSADFFARLSVAEAAGIPTINRRHAIAAVADKAHMATRLRAAGVPMPPTWIGSFEQIIREIPGTAYPLILKPAYGDHCRRIRIVNTRRALGKVEWSEPCVIAQRLLPSNGFDVKIYVIGGRVWAMRRPSPLHGAAAAANTLLRLPAAWRNLARHCGELFGLQLFGVDCIEFDGILNVIKVNDFPNYTAVPEADSLLADFVVQYAQARQKA